MRSRSPTDGTSGTGSPKPPAKKSPPTFAGGPARPGRGKDRSPRPLSSADNHIHELDGNDDRLRQWITNARAADLPHLHSFTLCLEQDLDAVITPFTLPHHNGRTEGVNTKTKMLKRQTYGREGFELLRHRILIT